MKLDELLVGESAQIVSVEGEGALRQHFLDMGLIPGVEVTVVKYAPMGDPIELKIHDYELTIRLADAKQIEITKQYQNHPKEYTLTELKKNHPGYGENGKLYHDKKTETPLSDDEVLTFALVGNQNCGKTTLFNQLTGSMQHVGNFPGVTVDRKDGHIKGYPQTLITDLPGIYSMSPYSSEEIVTREFLLKEKPKGIINIIDATNIERNLYLTMQLLELDMPMVVALNMMDELRKNDGSIMVSELEQLLGVPVVPISAVKNEGVDELVEHAIHVAKYQEKPMKQDFCPNESPLHRGIHAVMKLVEDHIQEADLPIRFVSTKIIEGDEKIIETLALSEHEKHILEEITQQIEKESNLDRVAIVAKMRFDFILSICYATVVKPKESIERIRSKRIDKLLTGKYTGIPLFIGIMAMIFYLTFNVIGAFLQDLLAMGIDQLTFMVDSLLTNIHVNTTLHSLITDGIFNGVGGVLSFLPIIVTLFFFLSLLEDSGYMARVAFIMDKLLRKLGLSGRSIVPMLIGFGCTVPGVMATRTLPSQRDRKMTILLTPFMSCTAKLPIYAFFTSVFFPENAGIVMIGLYVLGIIIGIIMALIFKKTAFKGEAVPFVMELPNYRLPAFKNTVHLLWDKSKDFLQRAFTVIFIATILIWFLQNFDLRLNMVSDSQNSILAYIAGFIAPIFEPLGFGDWRITTALISGFLAKESVVSSLTVLFGSTNAILATLSTASCLSLLVFCLLYTPCVAAIASIKRELDAKWATLIVIGQCMIAWVVSLITYMMMTL